MQLIGKEILGTFKNEHSDAQSQIDSWISEVEAATWRVPQDVGKRFKADFPGNNQIIFDICWNKYRIWVKVTYKSGIVIVKSVGTHKEYDKWKFK